MNFFSKTRLITWLVIILIVINISAIGTIVYHIYFSSESKQSDSNTKNIQNIIREELGLSPLQEQKYLRIKKEFDEKSSEILIEMKNKRQEMLDELSSADSNPEKLNNIAEDIGMLHTSLKKLTIENFLEMKILCDSDQCLKLRLLYNDMQMCEGQFSGMEKGKGMQHRWGQKAGHGKGSNYRKNQDQVN